MYAATSNPDTLYYHESLREPDADKFQEALKAEFKGLMDTDSVDIIPASEVPEGATVFPAVV